MYTFRLSETTIFNLKYELLQFHEHFQSPVNIFCLASKFFVFKEMIVFVLPQKMNRLELTLQVNCGPHFFSQKLRNLLIRSCFYRFEVGGRYDIILLIRSCFWFQALSCMQVLEVVCGLRRFFSQKFFTIVHSNQRKLVKKCLNLLIRSCF